MTTIEISDIWKYFYLNQVKYLTIGGFAVNFYGYNRSTGDIDILIEDTLPNRKNLRKAFKEIGIGDFEQLETMELIPGWTDFTVGYGMRLDIMTSIKGIGPEKFDALYKISETALIHDIPVVFIDYNSLILSKKATDRPKDRLDIEELEKIRKLLNDGNQE